MKGVFQTGRYALPYSSVLLFRKDFELLSYPPVVPHRWVFAIRSAQNILVDYKAPKEYFDGIVLRGTPWFDGFQLIKVSEVFAKEKHIVQGIIHDSAERLLLSANVGNYRIGRE